MPQGKRLKLTEEKREVVALRVQSALEAHEHAYKIPESSPDHGLFTNIHDRNQALIDGQYWDKLAAHDSGDDRTSPMYQVNLMVECIESKHAILVGGETAFVIHGTNKTFENVATEAKGVLSCDWKSHEWDDPHEDALWDSLIHGFGVTELFWQTTYKGGKAERTSEEPEREVDADLETGNSGDSGNWGDGGGDGLPSPAPVSQFTGNAADMMPMPTQPPSLEGSPNPEEVAQPKKADGEDEEPIYDAPTFERIAPCDFFIDPRHSKRNLSDCRYAFVRRNVPLLDLKHNKEYHNTEELAGELGNYFKQTGKDPAPENSQVAPDDLKTSEIWDGCMYLALGKETEEQFYHIIWSKELDKELFISPYQHPDFAKTGNPYPFQVIVNGATNNDKGIYGGISDVTALADLQRCFDASFTLIEWQRAHTPNVFKAPADFIHSDDGAKFLKDVGLNIEHVIAAMSADALGGAGWAAPPPQHTDSEMMVQNVKRLMMDRIGVTDYQANSTPSGPKRTKYESQQIATQGMTRQSKKVQDYHKYLSHSAMKALILIQQMTEDEREYVDSDETGKIEFGKTNVRRLRNGEADQKQPEPQGVFGRMAGKVAGMFGKAQTPEEFQEPGIQFVITIDASKQNPPNEQQERQDILEVLKALMPFLQTPDPLRPGQPMVDARTLLGSVLSKYNLPNQDDIIKPPPTKEEQAPIILQLQQTIQMLQQKIIQLTKLIGKMPRPQSIAAMQPGEAPQDMGGGGQEGGNAEPQ